MSPMLLGRVGGVERHQEVTVIGSTGTGTEVILSHVVPHFEPTRREEEADLEGANMMVCKRHDRSNQNSIKKGKMKAISEQTTASRQTQTTSTKTPTTNHYIFNQARNSPHCINLSFPTCTPLPENPSTSHPLSPPLPNSKGDNE